MEFTLNIGEGTIELDSDQVKNIQFRTEIPHDSNTREATHGAYIKVWGTIPFELDSTTCDPTLSIALWSQLPDHALDYYRNVVATIASSKHTIREFMLPNAFVVEYSESLDQTGLGEFYLHLKQRTDSTTHVAVSRRF
ncbi:MAG: hypothetical protein R3Y54_12660 [Eubacteriales bacterium]